MTFLKSHTWSVLLTINNNLHLHCSCHWILQTALCGKYILLYHLTSGEWGREKERGRRERENEWGKMNFDNLDLKCSKDTLSANRLGFIWLTNNRKCWSRTQSQVQVQCFVLLFYFLPISTFWTRVSRGYRNLASDLEKEMATHSSVLAWRIPGTGEPWWAAIYGVAQSRTRLKRLSSSSSSLWATGALGCTNLSPTWDSQSLDLETWGAILALLLGSLTTLTLGLSHQSEEVRF